MCVCTWSCECVCECVSKKKYWKRNVKMAIALVHLRRILLMCCILYLTSDLISELAQSVKTRNYLLIAVKRNFKIQFWTHVYIIYAYTIFMMNGFRWDQVNIFEIVFPTSWTKSAQKKYICIYKSVDVTYYVSKCMAHTKNKVKSKKIPLRAQETTIIAK